jgi:hypothetical protein
MTTRVAPQLIDQTNGIGYTTGNGGTATQETSKSTAVTLNAPCGQITMHNAALGAGAAVTFLLNNSFIDGNDLVLAQQAGWANYRVEAWANGAGSAAIRITNISGGSLSDAVLLNFAVIKSVTS